NGRCAVFRDWGSQRSWLFYRTEPERPKGKTFGHRNNSSSHQGALSRMNYRHIYHAGNFADVLKHAVLARLVLYMQGKDKAFRVLDTHAGIGLSDLSSQEAQKTGEWKDGIGRLLDGDMPAEAAAILAPYRSEEHTSELQSRENLVCRLL